MNLEFNNKYQYSFTGFTGFTGITGFTGCTGYSGPAQIFVNAQAFTGASIINEMDFEGLYVDVNSKTLFYDVNLNYVDPDSPLNVQMIDTYSLYLNETNSNFSNIICMSSLYQQVLNKFGLTISQTPVPLNVYPESFSFNNPYSLSILPSSFTGYTGPTGVYTGEYKNIQQNFFNNYK